MRWLAPWPTAALLAGCAGLCQGPYDPLADSSVTLHNLPPVQKVVSFLCKADGTAEGHIGSAFPLTASTSLSCGHLRRNEDCRTLIDGESAEVEEIGDGRVVEEFGDAKDMLGDWMCLRHDNQTEIPASLDANATVLAGSQVLVQGFPGPPESVRPDGSDLREKEVFFCRVIDRRRYPPDMSDDFVVVTLPRPDLKGLSGGPAAVYRDGEWVVFGMCIGSIRIDPFKRTLLQGIRTKEALLIRRIPEHLLKDGGGSPR